MVIIDLLQSIAEPLARAYDATRVRTWPIGEALPIHVIAGPEDPEHINLFLDAAETFHPGSSVTIWLDSEVPNEEVERAIAPTPGLELTWRPFKSMRRIIWRVPRPFHVVQLHPYPFMENVDHEALRRRAKFFLPHRTEWIYYRNLELWDGRKRATRRALAMLRRPIDAKLDRLIDKRFDELVRPKLEQARAWAGETQCEHERAYRVLNKPRPIDFCPDCGMGLTAPEAIPPAAKLAGIYGEHYSLGYRYVGRREYARFQREQVARVADYLDQLGFESPRKECPSILDFGCGGGLYTPLWIDRGWRYTGVDFAAGAIENARRNNPEAKFVVGGPDAREVTAGAPYDVIYLSHVLEHVPEPMKLLRDLLARSADGGWIYIEVPNAFRATWDLKHRGFANREHLWDFTPNALAAVAAAAGWKNIRTRTDPSDAYPNLSLLGRNANV